MLIRSCLLSLILLVTACSCFSEKWIKTQEKCFKIFYDGDNYFKIYCNKTLDHPSTNKTKKFSITTDKNDTIKFENIFNETKNGYTKLFSVKRGNEEFVDLGRMQILEYDCYSTEKHVPGRKIMCYYNNSSCIGYHRDNLHIILECYTVQMFRKMQESPDIKPTGDDSYITYKRAITYFCATCVRPKLPPRQ